MSPNRIFRKEALQHSLQQRERQNLSRFLPFPVLICLWIVIAALLMTGYVAWNTQLPTYTSGAGIIVSQQALSPSHGTNIHMHPTAEAVIFLSAEQAANIHKGQHITLTIGGGQLAISSTVQQISEQVMSPQVLNQRYGQGNMMVTQPSRVVLTMVPTIDLKTYTGSMVTAQIETGSQKILTMLIGGAVR